MRNLTLEVKIVIFKTIAISKIFFQSFITFVQKHIINELEKIQKAFFLWKNALFLRESMKLFVMTIRLED